MCSEWKLPGVLPAGCQMFHLAHERVGKRGVKGAGGTGGADITSFTCVGLHDSSATPVSGGHGGESEYA